VVLPEERSGGGCRLGVNIVPLSWSITVLRRLLGRLGSSAETEPFPSARLAPLDARVLGAADGHLEPVLRLVVQAAARVAGASAALVLLDRAGGVERFAAAGVDGCTRDTLVRAEVLGSLVRALERERRPIGPPDVETQVGRMLGAVAPQGFAALALGTGVAAVLVLLDPASGAFDARALDAAAMLALVGGAAIESARRVAALRESSEELRRLLARNLGRRDEELWQTARALHEGIGQRLAAANVQLEALRALVAGPASARLADARALVDQAIGELRNVAQELQPSVLEDFGYVQALRWYLDRVQERTPVSLSLDVENGETRLPQALETAFYRATEEAIDAVLAGAGAPRAPLRVRFERQPNAVRLEIGARPPERQSLVAIRERLRPFGGDVRVSGEETAFVLELPT